MRGRHRTVLGVALALGVLLSSTAGAAERVTARIGHGHFMAYLPIYVAKDGGLFAEEGVDAEITIITGAAVLQALAAGSLDFAAALAPSIVASMAKGLPFITVAANQNRLDLELTLRKDTAASKGISSTLPVQARIERLRGLKIGVSGAGSSPDLTLRWLLRRSGLDPERDAVIVAISAGETFNPALKSGRIDAMFTGPPRGAVAEAEGYGTIVFSSAAGEIAEIRQLPASLVITRRDLAERNPELIGRVARALGRANNLLQDQPDLARQILGKSWGGIPADILARTLETLRQATPRGARMTEEEWRAGNRFFIEAGFSKEALEAREGKFWTNRFLEARPK